MSITPVTGITDEVNDMHIDVINLLLMKNMKRGREINCTRGYDTNFVLIHFNPRQMHILMRITI